MTTSRAALVTGGSSGIGFAIAEMLAQDGYAVTIAARRPEKLEAAAERLRAAGHTIEHVAGDLGTEEAVEHVVARHGECFGRLDVLVNNAGVGVGQAAGEITAKAIDLQFATNLRSVFLFQRAALPLLTEAGAEHGNALVVNVASLSGKRAEAWLGVYSATKHGVVGFTEAMNKELGSKGIKSVALCPGFVDTPMTGFLTERGVDPESMIQTVDVAAAVRFVLGTSRGCVVPEIVFHDRTGLTSDASSAPLG